MIVLIPVLVSEWFAILGIVGKERAENSGAAAAAGSKLDILMPTSEQVLVVLVDLWHLLLYFYITINNGTHQ